MAKNLGKILAASVVVAMVLFGSAQKADADLALSLVSTTVYSSQDMDTNRTGTQIMYEWGLRNQEPPAASYTEDALWKVTIGTDLAARGMYGFDDNNYFNNFDWRNYPQWSSGSDNGSYSWFADQVGNESIRPNDIHYFRALIDADLVIGQEQVGIQGFANSGSTQIAQIDVPIAIPEPMTFGLLASGVGVLLAGRKVKGITGRYNPSARPHLYLRWNAISERV
ncbi:MAG: hypothetical protein WCG03_05365 [Kiritimatiellales bacterium]